MSKKIIDSDKLQKVSGGNDELDNQVNPLDGVRLDYSINPTDGAIDPGSVRNSSTLPIDQGVSK